MFDLDINNIPQTEAANGEVVGPNRQDNSSFLKDLHNRIKLIELSPELSPPEKSKLITRIKRELCKRDLFFLINQILGYKDVTDWHKSLCNSTTLYKDWWHLHLHPRGHFKSTLLTIGENIQDILINPNITILITNAVLDKSKAFLREIKSHFQYNNLFRDLFPEHNVDERKQEGTQESWTSPARTHHYIREGTVETTGIEKAVVSAHYDKITFDDIVNEINVSTPEQRKKVLSRYREYLSLLNPPGCVRIVGTRWHYDDVYGWLLERLKNDEEEFEFKIFHSMVYKNIETREPIFPERFTPKVVERLRRNQGQYIFSCQYLNNPQPEEDKVFNRKNLHIVSKVNIPATTYTYRFSSCDPAITQNARSDPTCITTIEVNCDGNIYVINVRRGYWNPDEIIYQCLDVCRKYEPRKFGFETTAFQRVIKYYLEKEKRKTNIRVPIVEISRNTRVHKEDRIQRIEPFLKNGLLFVVDDPIDISSETIEFMEELDTFPYGKYDDILDSLSDCIELHSVPPKQRPHKIIYEPADPTSKYRTGARYKMRTVPIYD